jgi:hypothetical protein
MVAADTFDRSTGAAVAWVPSMAVVAASPAVARTATVRRMWMNFTVQPPHDEGALGAGAPLT